VETISFVRRGQRKPSETTVDVTRRGLLAGMFGGIIAAPLLRLRFWQQEGKGNPILVRPPGIDTEEEFLAKCVRCGTCMKVCVTNGLQPVMLEDGLGAFMTPKLISRVGYCAYECNICGQVCPSDAIKPLSLEEKQKVVIGKAFFDRSRCMPWAAYHIVSNTTDTQVEWTDAFNCAVCEEHCPVPDKAIKFSPYPFRDGDPEHVINRPYVILERCIGCGICENKCPLPGRAAITVTAVDQTNPDQPQRFG
jgi:ferredoxin